MSVTVGPSSFWMRTKESADFYAVRCPVGTTLGDGSRIFCKTGGRAWIVAPASTQVSSAWADGKYNNIDVPGTEICCISEWTILCAALISNCFNPCDWFVPNLSQLQSGYNCRCNWDSFSGTCYWTSTESNSTLACRWNFLNPGSPPCSVCKACGDQIRAFRCVTY